MDGAATSDAKMPRWAEGKPNTFSIHLKTPEIDLETHRQIRRAQLSYQLRKQHRIYLDTNYWVNLRRASAGEPE